MAVLAALGWSGGSASARAEEQKKLKRLLINSGRPSMSHGAHRSRGDHSVLKKLTEWFELTLLARAEEGTQRMSERDLVWPWDHQQARLADVQDVEAAPLQTVLCAYDRSGAAEEGGARGGGGAGAERTHEAPLARPRDPSAGGAGGGPPDGEEEEDSGGAIVTFLNSVKTSVVAALFGERRSGSVERLLSGRRSGGRRASAEEPAAGAGAGEAGETGEAERPGARLDLPSPEEALWNWQDAARRLQGRMLGDTPGAAAEEEAPAAGPAGGSGALGGADSGPQAAGAAAAAPAPPADAAPAAAEALAAAAPAAAGAAAPPPAAAGTAAAAGAPAAAEALPAVDLESLALPTAPGMEDANLVVKVDIEPRTYEAAVGGAAGVRRFMARPGGAILVAMAQDGWEVSPLDASRGLYEVSLPSVQYEVGGSTVSIPSPVFAASVYDSFKRNGDYEERLQGDLVLENGDDILKVELGFPFRTTLNISVSAWTRCRIGWKDGVVSVSNVVEVGVQVPQVPGLKQLLQYFIRAYGEESTLQVATALARAADEPPPDAEPEPEAPAKPAPVAAAPPAAEAEAAAPSVGSAAEAAPAAQEAPARAAPSDAAGAADVPSPDVPGMDDSNLTVNVEVEPRVAEVGEGLAPQVQRFMAQDGGAILQAMAQEGWEINTVDAGRGLYEILLPSVRYEVAGSTVSIPSPRFLATVRGSSRRSGGYTERLSGDLVLQNGRDIITVELGFPFRTTFSISCAGWTRCLIGWEGGGISVSNVIRLGLKAPSVPGLTSVLQYFVKSYGNESTLEVAQALARGAEALPPESPAEQISKALGQASSSASRALGEASSSVVEAARKGMAELPLIGGPAAPAASAAAAAGREEADATPALAPGDTADDGAPPAEPPAWFGPPETRVVAGRFPTDLRALPPPAVPGLEAANLVVKVDIDPKLAEPETRSAGVSRLMEQSGGIILSTMAREGWDVKAIDPDAGLYELSLPSVDYSLSGGSVSIPSPRFATTVQDLFRRVDDGLTERLLGDLVLVNGEDLVTVKLGFPFNTTLSLSAAGYTRCLVGFEADRISVSAYIEVGLRLPSVPGLEQLMRFFVRTYGAESTSQVANSLARGADDLPPQPEALTDWLVQQWQTLLEATDKLRLALGPLAAASASEPGAEAPGEPGPGAGRT